MDNIFACVSMSCLQNPVLSREETKTRNSPKNVNFENLLLTVFNHQGQSYEGRDMDVLAITKAGPGAPNIWLEVIVKRK